MLTITGRWSRGTGSVALTGPNRRQETTPSASHDAPPAPYDGSALEFVLARVLVRRLLPAMVKRRVEPTVVYGMTTLAG